MNEAIEVCQALSCARVAIGADDNGFVADIIIATERMSEDQRTWLANCLTGYFSEDHATFHSPVVDNLEDPVVFNDEQGARKAALERCGSLVNQFSFGFYSEYGHILDYKPSATLMFVPRAKLKSNKH